MHVLDNPDAASEVRLLRAYAPSLAASPGDDGEILLGRIAGAFSDLRELHTGAIGICFKKSD